MAWLIIFFPSAVQKSTDMSIEYLSTKVRERGEFKRSTLLGEGALKGENNGTTWNAFLTTLCKTWIFMAVMAENAATAPGRSCKDYLEKEESETLGQARSTMDVWISSLAVTLGCEEECSD